jgi:outer membrane receptor protein involved in Fe transport
LDHARPAQERARAVHSNLRGRSRHPAKAALVQLWVVQFVMTIDRLYTKTWLTVLCLSFWIGSAAAQTTTGTISGRVLDAQELALPGVTVSATSPNLQGVRETVTSPNGDYILTLLPSGTYTVTFELAGFQTQQRSVTVAPTQAVPMNVSMGVAGLEEAIEVVGRTADVLTQTAQVATNFRQDLIAALPTTRDINASMLLAPSVHATGPSGNYSIAGAMSYENLFMVNGVTVNENLRGQPYNLYIEDAIQETTIATAGISAEYGRFGGGVVNMITKSGGNQFSGSFRATLNNDDWRSRVSPRTGDQFSSDTKIDATVPAYEYTFGGPVLRDRRLVLHGRPARDARGEPADAGDEYRSGLPGSVAPVRRQGHLLAEREPPLPGRLHADRAESGEQHVQRGRLDGSEQLPSTTAARGPVHHQLQRRDHAVLLRRSALLAAPSELRRVGGHDRDLVEGTLLIDQSRNPPGRYWSPTFCGVCTDETRDNQNVFVKANYFLSTRGLGAHNLSFGYDNFNDMRLANNHQSGSDYRILGTSSIVQGTGTSAVISPVFLGNGTTIIQWNPIPEPSQGSDFRTHSVFVNDSWNVTNRLTANLGVRWDRNDGRDQSGNLVTTDSALSPRLGVVWDPTGAGEWSVTGSFGKYVAAISNSIANSASPAGNPQTFQFQYRGPDINPDGVAVTPTAQAVRQLFDWFFDNGGPDLPFHTAPSIPGLTPQIGANLQSPNVLEYATGVNRSFGGRAALRADYIFRDFRDFYVSRTDLSTGSVADPFGRAFDLTLIENSNVPKRRYHGLTTQGTYRFAPGVEVGATYTLSRLRGNWDGENVVSGPITFGGLQYPEYKEERWNYPEGDLSGDQRHRARLWVTYSVPRVAGLTLSALQAVESGVPYGPGGAPLQGGNSNGVDPRPYVTNPGYVVPPAGSVTAYHFMARDAFRTEGQRRTDFAANYARRLPGAGGVELFGQLQVVNLFDQRQLCGCGASVFLNGGNVTSTTIDQSVRNAVTHPALYQRFNPFTETPQQGVHWDFGPNFGNA